MVADLLGSLQPRDTTAARRQMAMELMNQGRSSAPIQSPWQGLANMASAYLGAATLGGVQSEEEARKAAKSKALAEALRLQAEGPTESRPALIDAPGPAMEGSGVEAGYSAPARPSGAKLAAALLGKNEDTAELGMRMMSQANADETTQQRDRERRAEDFRYRGMERADTQDFQRQQMASQQAQAERMAQMQIAATQGNAEAQRALQMELAKMGQADRAPNTIETAEGVFVLNRDGTLGNRIGSPKSGAAMNNDQSNAALYADRMRASNDILSTTGAVQADPKQRALGGVPLVGNYLVSPEYQKADQAQRDFINATLRRESGAAISPSEFENARKQYFPQPGDQDEVLAQKAANRAMAITGISRAAGPAYKPQTAAPTPPGRNDRLDRAMGGLSPDEAAELAALRARFGGRK